ncbi:metallophosphoesterase family protein [Virgibacillus saliphilus]|uniref:metallophosphoesterase family protein n=1 Tax=Virgibacillus saliphilus TaxID=2831674 RepID=UPI0021041553|nr:metallophosphoesterase [Virgibacillus sp. NKC19-3]
MTKDSQHKKSQEPFHLEKADKTVDRRTFLKRTSQVAGTALVVTATGSLNAIPVSALTSKGKNANQDTNQNAYNLIFPVISDVHIQGDSDHTLNKFTETMQQLNRMVPNQDALITVGDLTDNGYEEEYNRFKSVYDKNKQSQAVSMFAIGNHDYWNGLSAPEAQELFLQKREWSQYIIIKKSKATTLLSLLRRMN